MIQRNIHFEDLLMLGKIIYFYSFNPACMREECMCLHKPEDSDATGAGVTGGCLLSWETSGPQQEQSLFLTTKSSSAPTMGGLKCRYLC